jgi:SH3-like domain-containing protein
MHRPWRSLHRSIACLALLGLTAQPGWPQATPPTAGAPTSTHANKPHKPQGAAAPAHAEPPTHSPAAGVAAPPGKGTSGAKPASAAAKMVAPPKAAPAKVAPAKVAPAKVSPKALAKVPAKPPAPPAAATKPAEKPPAPAVAERATEQPAKGSATGLPLPRFAALRSDEVNLRAGPGTRYPIDWVYKRRDLPVQIEREFEVWRLVVDPEGVKGWVHQATLAGRRSFLVLGAERRMRGKPDDEASLVALLKPGVVGHIMHCDAGSDWCRVQVDEYRGWLKRQEFWGSFNGEAIN